MENEDRGSEDKEKMLRKVGKVITEKRSYQKRETERKITLSLARISEAEEREREEPRYSSESTQKIIVIKYK